MNRSLMVWLILSLIWGSTWLFIKLGLQDLPPISFAGIRFLIAAAILWMLIILRRRPLPRHSSDWWIVLLTGILGFTFNYGLLFWGEQYISSGLAAVLQAIIPVFGLIIAHYQLANERISVKKVIGSLMGMGGVVLIFADQIKVGGKMALAGSIAVVLGALSIAYSNVLIKARASHLDPAVLAGGQMVCGFIPLLTIGMVWEGNPLKFHWTINAIVALCYLALVGSAIAFLLYYWLVKRMAVTKTMLISLITPVIAVILGMVIFNEELSWRLLMGSICIIAGIGLIVRERMQTTTT